jgi:hypothetical protein
MTGALLGKPFGNRSAAVGILDVLDEAIRSLFTCDGASWNPLVGFGVEATDEGGRSPTGCGAAGVGVWSVTGLGVPVPEAGLLPTTDPLGLVAGRDPGVGGLDGVFDWFACC